MKETLEKYEKDEKFKYLKNNTAKIQKQLEEKNVKNIQFYTNKQTELFELPHYNERTILMFPKLKSIQEATYDTKAIIHRMMNYTSEEIQQKTNAFSSNIETEAIIYESKPFYYEIIEKNIIIPKLNIFYNQKIFNEFIQQLENKKITTKKEYDTLTVEMALTKLFEQDHNRLKEEKENTIQTINSIQNNYGTNLRRLRQINAKLEKSQEKLYTQTPKIIKEIEEIKNLPFVKKIQLGKFLYVDFGEIIMTHNIIVGKTQKDGVEVPLIKKTAVNLGELYIKIRPNTITVHTKKESNNPYPHPHVNTSNGPCFGTLQSEIYNALQDVHLKKLITLLYQWITQYNKKDTYCKLEEFYENGDE